MSDAYPELVDPAFWRQPLDDRMARFAELREIAPFLPARFVNPVAGFEESFYVATRYDGGDRDQPPPAGLLLGSGCRVDPRHARGRHGVLRVVHQHGRPATRATAGDRRPFVHPETAPERCSTRSRRSAPRSSTRCANSGEVDLVEALSQPFPLLVICDMMGIPRSEFDTVLDATNVILGAGDPDVLAGRDPMSRHARGGHAAHARSSTTSPSSAAPSRPTISSPRS